MKNLAQAFVDAFVRSSQTMALCVKITRQDGQEFCFTTHDKTLAFPNSSPDYYRPHPGIISSPLEFGDEGAVGTFSVALGYSDSLDISGVDVAVDGTNEGYMSSSAKFEDVVVGQWILVEGFTTSANNGLKKVTEKLKNLNLSSSAISVDGATEKYTDTAAGGLFADVVVGRWIIVAGFTDAANNGAKRVTSKPDNDNIVVDSNLETEVQGDAITINAGGIIVDSSLSDESPGDAVTITGGGITQADVQAGHFANASVEAFVVNFKDLPSVMTAPDRKNGSPTCSISSDVLTVSIAQVTGTNWDVGDRIQYDTEKYCWIASITDTTHCNVADRFGTANIPDAASSDVEEISTGFKFIKFAADAGDIAVHDAEVVIEFHSLLQYLKNTLGDVITPYCTARFCDVKRGVRAASADRQCKFDPANYEFTGTIASVVSANREFTATMSGGNTDDYFTYGELEWTSGNNRGLFADIRLHAYSGGVHTFTLMRDSGLAVQVGDTFSVLAGCDRLEDSCQTKWATNNMANFRGFTKVPGPDVMSQTPKV